MTVLLAIPELFIAFYTAWITVRVGKLPSNPNRYFKNKGRGRLYVRPQDSRKWMKYEEWAKESMFS